MKKYQRVGLWFAAAFILPACLYAQNAANYDKKQVFDQQFFPNNSNGM